MTIVELKKKYDLDKRSHEVCCSVCGKKIVVPIMYSEIVRKAILHPYCCAATALTCQWLIHHGWHVSSIEANPPHQYYCPDCFPKGTPEYHKASYAADWCEQAEKWMKEGYVARVHKTSDFIESKRIAYNRVKRILDSLPEQPASESSEKIGQLNVLPKSARHSEGLEEAAENIYKTPFGTRTEDFKAGAEWGAKHLKR